MATKKTVEQQIAETERRLARLKQASRAKETGQKVIIGGLVIAAAKRDEKVRKWLLEQIAENVKREADQKRLDSLMEELKC